MESISRRKVGVCFIRIERVMKRSGIFGPKGCFLKTSRVKSQEYTLTFLHSSDSNALE